MLLLSSVVALLGCASNFVTWKEEVKLNDGRVIVVTQKKRCEAAYTGSNFSRCIARDSWLTIPADQFGNEEIVWHEQLKPLVLNVNEGRLYIVGFPPTGLEFWNYERPKPPYIGFVFEQGGWERIPFEQIPEPIYTINMLIESKPPIGIAYVSIETKESRSLNGDPTYHPSLRRIDPALKWGRP